MNPNMMYGQQMPMQPPSQRRHDGSYAPMPAQMRPHPGYQQYYHPQMSPIMPQYPQHYQPNWYGYQQAPMPHHPGLHQSRSYQHYPQGPLVAPQYAQHHGPMVVSSHPHVQPSPGPMHQQLHQRNQIPPPPSSAPQSSVSSSVPVQAPPSPPLSTPGSSVVQPKSSRASTPVAEVLPVIAELVRPSTPYYPPLPWVSSEDQSFPARAPRRKRKIARSALATEPIVFPREQPPQELPTEDDPTPTLEERVHEVEDDIPHESMPTPTQTGTPLASEAPSDVPSDAGSTHPTTPSSAVDPFSEKTQRTPTQPKAHRVTKSVVPAVPILPQSPNTAKRGHRDSIVSTTSKTSSLAAATASQDVIADDADDAPATGSEEISSLAAPVISPSVAPKSWADLVRSQAKAAAPSASQASLQIPNGLGGVKIESLSEVLNDMSTGETEAASKVVLLEPRGLVNTGNMCYMNSVLQVLVFCIPFYDFLNKLSLRAPHTFKSDTPLIDAMIMFMQEYPTIDSAPSVEKLRMRLKQDDFEKYGEPLIPEYVYEVIKQLPRFRDMRRGHQQDAQEFLGFLLEELHEECATAMRRGTSVSSGRSTPVNGVSTMADVADNDGEWSEVGRKQKPSTVRSSGAILTESPITNIFGGKLRSELKIQGNKMSVTLEPYQPLQLDIGSPQVNNILDALKGITTPESMQGDFQSVRGKVDRASKQVFIETLPPVLILHLKRFHYDSNTKRTEKIWKKVGYPLELEMPKEVFPQQVRSRLAAHGGLPKYRLTGVIYHHGKNANGGHYTVDIRRQDGKEWIRLDDTLIRRIRCEDVAEGGSEENPKVLAAALERHKQQKVSGNRFEQIEQDEDEEDSGSEKVWNHVNGHSRNKSTMSAIINGSATPAKDSSGVPTPSQKSSVKDNKVAYLLFYQRITT